MSQKRPFDNEELSLPDKRPCREAESSMERTYQHDEQINWILQNYRPQIHSTVFSDEIFASCTEFCHESQIKLLDRKTLGKVIANCYPVVRNSKKRLDGNRQIIRVCLSIWARSPKAYEELKKFGMLHLSSGRLLRLYKNCIRQSPGFLPDMLRWMMSEADKLGFEFGSPERCGGVAVDEMSIQDDLVMCKTGDVCKIVGMVDVGHEELVMRTLMSGFPVQTCQNIVPFIKNVSCHLVESLILFTTCGKLFNLLAMTTAVE